MRHSCPGSRPLATADELAERLDDYAAALERDSGDDDDSELLPF